MSLYREFRFFSPAMDCEALRLSMCDDRGSEYWAVIPAMGGRREREAKQAALDRIDDAIRGGCEPGCVGLSTTGV